MAVQQWLGILPKWWFGIGGAYFAHPRPDRKVVGNMIRLAWVKEPGQFYLSVQFIYKEAHHDYG